MCVLWSIWVLMCNIITYCYSNIPVLFSKINIHVMEIVGPLYFILPHNDVFNPHRTFCPVVHYSLAKNGTRVKLGYCVLGSEVVWSVKELPTFWRSTLTWGSRFLWNVGIYQFKKCHISEGNKLSITAVKPLKYQNLFTYIWPESQLWNSVIFLLP